MINSYIFGTSFDIVGGSISYPSGYKVSTFTSNSSITVYGSGTINYEIVAGGASAGDPGVGSGGRRGGGGGAGEVKRGSMSITPGTYDIIVGLGGIYPTQLPGADGGASSALGITSAGGGGGGGGATGSAAVGRPGGSGGGAGALSSGFTGGASTASGGGLGNSGGGAGGTTTSERRGGGGGGAGGAGSNGPASGTSGVGGAGVTSICPGVSATYSVGGNGYVGDNNPTAPSVFGCGGHAGGSIGAGTSGANGVVHLWITQ